MMVNTRFEVELKAEDKDLPSYYVSEYGKFAIDTNNNVLVVLTTTKGSYPLKHIGTNGLNMWFYRVVISGIVVDVLKRPDDRTATVYYQHEVAAEKLPRCCEDCKKMHVLCTYDDERWRCDILS